MSQTPGRLIVSCCLEVTVLCGRIETVLPTHSLFVKKVTIYHWVLIYFVLIIIFMQCKIKVNTHLEADSPKNNSKARVGSICEPSLYFVQGPTVSVPEHHD